MELFAIYTYNVTRSPENECNIPVNLKKKNWFQLSAAKREGDNFVKSLKVIGI